MHGVKMTRSPGFCFAVLHAIGKTLPFAEGKPWQPSPVSIRIRIRHQTPIPCMCSCHDRDAQTVQFERQGLFYHPSHGAVLKISCLVCTAGLQAADKVGSRGREIRVWAREVECGAGLWEGFIRAPCPPLPFPPSAASGLGLPYRG
jgi:hypothetical protein